MKAILSTTFIGLVVACSSQQPANSPALQSTAEPAVERAHTNATGGSNETTAASITPTAPETVPAAPQPAANPPPSGTQKPDRANSVAAPGAAQHDAANPQNSDREERADAPTPIDQGESATDRAATQQIRKALMADDSLSFTAKNVKIITLNGKVTLRGSVNSARERTTIEAAAKKASGVTSVDNQLEVKTQSSGGR
jgi:hyperosmotically inducible protein